MSGHRVRAAVAVLVFLVVYNGLCLAGVDWLAAWSLGVAWGCVVGTWGGRLGGGPRA